MMTLKFKFAQEHKKLVSFDELGGTRIIGKLYMRMSELPEDFDRSKPFELTIKYPKAAKKAAEKAA